MASFRIHEDQENFGEALRKNTKVLQNATNKNTKRTALGEMNKNPSSRIPLLANKSLKNDSCIQIENIFNKPQHMTKPFVIHETSKTVTEKPKIKPQNENIKPIIIDNIEEEEEELCPIISKLDPELELTKQTNDENDDDQIPMVLTPIQKSESKALSHVPLDVEEYKEHIDSYLREMEKKYRPKPNYMRKQHDINYSMRAILVEWLVEVAEEYKLQTETLYLAVGYIDRFLSQMSVVRAKLQLLGTAAMFIAAKYEEIYPPDISEFVYITDDTYTKKQVLRMEQLILGVLHFNMSSPSVLSFITSICVDLKSSDSELYLAMYLSELSLLEGDPYLQYLPSMRACGAIALSRYTLDLTPWDEKMEKITDYTLDDLEPIINDLTKTFAKAPSLAQQAIREKYKTNRYNNVALMLPKEISLF